jgi:hypothetical protein
MDAYISRKLEGKRLLEKSKARGKGKYKMDNNIF